MQKGTKRRDLVLTGSEEKPSEREDSGSLLAASLPSSSLFVTDKQRGRICIRASKRYRMAHGAMKQRRQVELHSNTSD